MAKRKKNPARTPDAYDYRDGYAAERPQRKKRGVFSLLLIILSAAVFLVSAAMLVNELLIKPYFNDKSLTEIQAELEEETPESGEEQVELERQDGTKEVVTVNDTVRAVNKLREKYPDIVGWIKVPGTEIHFPVVQSSAADPEYYLYRNYRGEDTEYGSIFLDARGSVESANQILHGHSMLDKRMFYHLIDFGKLEVYKKSPVVQYDTYEEAGDWKIVSVYKTNTNPEHGAYFDYFISDFESEAEKLEYVYQVMNRSIIDTGVDIKEGDRFISLSTCSYELEDFRTVVVARKVRPGEDKAVDTTKARLRGADTLYPQGWYAVNGGSRPDYPATFQEAKAQGLTPWFSE